MKKDKRIKLLKWALVISIIINVFVGYGYVKRQSYIHSYHNTMISYTRGHIAQAHSRVIDIQRYDGQERRVTPLIQAATHLETASEYIGHYSILYTFNSRRTGYGANAEARALFQSYSGVLNNWARAIQLGEIENMPSDEDIDHMVEDITNMTEKFVVYANTEHGNKDAIAKLDYLGMRDLLTLLAEETKTEAVKDNLDQIFFRRF